MIILSYMLSFPKLHVQDDITGIFIQPPRTRCTFILKYPIRRSTYKSHQKHRFPPFLVEFSVTPGKLSKAINPIQEGTRKDIRPTYYYRHQSTMSNKSFPTKWSRFCLPGIILVAKSAQFSAVGMCPVKDSPIATHSHIAW